MVLVLGFRAIDIVLRALEPYMPKGTRKRAIDKAVAFVTERLNGIDGLGAIYPAMENSVKMYAVLGYPPDHPDRKIARASLDKLLVIKEDEAYCQPCVSPVWDTSLVAHVLLEAGGEKAVAAANRGSIAQTVADPGREGRLGRATPDVRPGGWAFQYNNAHYPISTIPRSLPWRWIACVASAARSSMPQSTGRANGSSVCNAGMAASAPSMPTMPTTISTTSVRRSRRAARSADRGPHRALFVPAGPTRGAARDFRSDAPRRSHGCGAISYLTEAGTAAGA